MAKIVLTINANNKATQSVKLLNAEVQTLSKTLSSIKVNKNLTAQINALTKHYTALAKAAVRVNEATTKRQIAEQRLVNEVKRGRTEDQRTLKVQAQKETAQLRLKQAQDKATQSTQKQTTATKQNTAVNKEHRQSILSMTRGILEWQIATTLVMKPLRALQDALASINETLVKTEDSVIALQRVLPSGSATDGEISSRLYKIAQDYGQTFDNVSQIAENFARTGMSWADTIKATEAAVLALNVAELDAEEATNGLIAILSQFGLEASDLETVIDKLNKTADNFPVTTEKILAALQRTGSAADNANLSLDQTIALITALSKATGRSGENIGTALNSLIQYSSKSSALDTFAKLSEDTEKVVAKYRQGGATILDVWQAVSNEIKNLKSEQADLLDGYFNTDDGSALKEALDGELEDIYTELGGVYDTANTFRKNYFIALLGNMDTVEQAIGTLGSAAGYSQDENQKYLDTYTAKLNTLKAQWEDIANSQQGLLGIKKFLVDIGSALLTIVKWTGGLRTTLLAVATVVWTLKGAKIIAGIKSIGTAIKGLITGLRTATTAAQGLQAALGVIGLVATSISFVIGLAQQAEEEIESLNAENLNRASEGLSTLKDNVQQNIDRFDELGKTIKEAREVLSDSSSTTNEISSAQNTLLEIQNSLIKSNKEYADSLDLTNGNLATQLDLVAKMGEQNARDKVQEYLDKHADAIYNAKKYRDEKLTNIVFGETFDYWDKTQPLMKWLESQGFSTYQESGREGSNFFDMLGDILTINKFNTGINTSGMTRDEQIDFLETLYKKAQYEENAGYLQAQIRGVINAIENDDSYKNVENILSGSDNSWNAPIEVLEEFAKGGDYEEFLRKIGLLQEDITNEAGEWHNNISKVTGKYDDLISKLEELRDLQKESTEWEEKKLAVMEAEQALENARNEATVRRFNQATGQWEWQTDEKKIAEAEKNLEQAQLNLQEAAYSNIIEQLENETATNESILAILKEVAPLLGADNDFVDAVINAFKDKTGVDITKPAISNFDAAQNYINKNGLKESDREKWTEDKTFEKLFNALTDEEKKKLKGTYDNGGVANGLGVMVKATDKPETVNDPELTRKILSPVSNAEFNRYVRDMGIMFERSHQYAQTPIIERVGGAVDNRVNNSGQVFIQDVNVGTEKRDGIMDALSLAPLMNNN